MERFAPVWLRPIVTALAVLLLLSLFTGEIRDTDIWLHLKTGQHTLETHALTVPDPFSYTSGMGAASYPGEEVTRYFNLTHEWLAQIAMYLIYSATGFAGLVLARAALLIVFCALVGWIAYRRSGGAFVAGLAAALMAAAVAFHFQQSRPFVVTFVFLAITMAVLESRRWIWALPPIFLIWANCHAGFFVGLLVLAAYCGEALVARLRRNPLEDDRRLWIVAAACLLASALNPNGFRVVQIVFFYRQSTIQSNNLEWQRPIFWKPDIYSFLLFGSLAALAAAWRRVRAVDWLLYLGFAAISLMAVRNVIFMGLVGPVVMAAYAPRPTLRQKDCWVAAAAAGLLAAALAWYDLAPAVAGGNTFALRAAEWQLPSGAAGFIQSHRISSRMFNPYESGGYLVWRLWPSQRDFIDPRGLSEEAYTDYQHLLMNQDSGKLLRKYGIELVVLEGFDYLSGQVYPLAVELADPRQTEWKLVHADAQSLLFLRHPPSGMAPPDSRAALLASLDGQCGTHLAHDPARPRCARGLSELYAALGNVDQALRWMDRYLEIRAEADPEAERIAASLRVTAMNSQAQALEAKGDLAAAESLLRTAAALAEKALGPYHQDFAGALNNLASLLESEGDTAGAEALYRRALAICEKALGPDDPHTAASLDNLAGLLAAKGDWTEAEPLYRRALAVAEKSLGPDHPTTQGIRAELNQLHPKPRR